MRHKTTLILGEKNELDIYSRVDELK